jgi:hypothetical protein
MSEVIERYRCLADQFGERVEATPDDIGPKVEPPEGADPQTRFLCFLGRRV